jgi:tRNA pseudouridine13 synthase
MFIIKAMPEDFVVEEISSLSPGKNGQYTYFVLKKSNYNTEDALQKLALAVRAERKMFGHAGNKDRAAVTSQVCSFRGGLKDMDLKDLQVRIIGRGEAPVSLGDLAGNRFTIVVRNIDMGPDQVDYIINYFDEQRFSENNFRAGLSILKKDFKTAAELMATPMLQTHLQRYPGDYVGALREIPLKIRMIYINSVQSLIWNEAVSSLMKGDVHAKAIPYSLGEFIFPSGRPEDLVLPLVSFDTEFASRDIESRFLDALARHGLSMKEFIVRQMPEVTARGSERHMIAELTDCRVSQLEEDDLNPPMKKVTVSFRLGKGSYATLVIKRMFAGREQVA